MTSVDPQRFLQQIRGVELDKALALVGEKVAAVPQWSETKCVEWLVPMLQNDLEDELRAAVDGLPSACLERLAALRVGTIDEEFWEVVVERCAGDSSTIEIPARFLVPRYKVWLEQGVAPAFTAYTRQLVRRATGGDRAQLAVLAQATVADCYGVDLQAATLRDVRDLAPEELPSLVEIVLASGDEYQAAEAQVMQRWLDRLPPLGAEGGIVELPGPSVIGSYATRPLDEAACREAIRWLASSVEDVWSVDRASLQALIERDSRILKPVIPLVLARLVCVQARETIADLLRMESVGGASVLVECALLSLIVEQQLRHSLASELDSAQRRKFDGVGLAELAEFTNGRRTARLERFELRRRADESVCRLLTQAGRLRNLVHHEPGRLSRVNADDFRRWIIGVGGEPGALLVGIASLRAKSRD